MQNKAQVELIAGETGTLEVRHFGLADAERQRLAIICHPHTLYGGTMDNKVVVTIERALQAQGFATICFNFRGAGRSEGAYDNGVGEQADLARVQDWGFQQRAAAGVKTLQSWLSGFSFGSYVVLKTHSQLKADQLLLVAPPVGLYDFSDIEVSVPWSVIQGGQDEVVDAQEILSWLRQQAPMPDLYWRSGASHFFHRQLVWLKGCVALISES